MWRLEIRHVAPSESTLVATASTRAAADRLDEGAARTNPGCKELDQGERAVSDKVVKGRLCEVDHVGSRHGGDGSEAGKEGGGAHLLREGERANVSLSLSPAWPVRVASLRVRAWVERVERRNPPSRASAVAFVESRQIIHPMTWHLLALVLYCEF